AGTDQSTADEDKDRSSIALPGAQSSLIDQVAAANPNTIVYAETIGPVDVSSFEGNVSALLWSSYNGERKGEALADVLVGAYTPSGRTPLAVAARRLAAAERDGLRHPPDRHHPRADVHV